MNAAIPCTPKRMNWRLLYQTAVSETDKNMIALRLSEAEEAVLARAREVFYGGFDSEEWKDLEDAFDAIDATKKALPHTRAA